MVPHLIFQFRAAFLSRPSNAIGYYATAKGPSIEARTAESRGESASLSPPATNAQKLSTIRPNIILIAAMSKTNEIITCNSMPTNENFQASLFIWIIMEIVKCIKVPRLRSTLWHMLAGA